MFLLGWNLLEGFCISLCSDLGSDEQKGGEEHYTQYSVIILESNDGETVHYQSLEKRAWWARMDIGRVKVEVREGTSPCTPRAAVPAWQTEKAREDRILNEPCVSSHHVTAELEWEGGHVCLSECLVMPGRQPQWSLESMRR